MDLVDQIEALLTRLQAVRLGREVLPDDPEALVHLAARLDTLRVECELSGLALPVTHYTQTATIPLEEEQTPPYSPTPTPEETGETGKD